MKTVIPCGRWLRGLAGLLALAGGMLTGACAHEHRHRELQEVVVIRDERGFEHRGAYDRRGVWHGGWYDERRVYHDDEPEWGRGRR